MKQRDLVSSPGKPCLCEQCVERTDSGDQDEPHDRPVSDRACASIAQLFMHSSSLASRNLNATFGGPSECWTRAPVRVRTGRWWSQLLRHVGALERLTRLLNGSTLVLGAFRFPTIRSRRSSSCPGWWPSGSRRQCFGGGWRLGAAHR